MAWVIVSGADIESRYGPLSAAETEVIGQMITDASDVLELSAADRGIPAPTDVAAIRAYVRIVATMVIRVLRNPDGYLTETIDDYTYRRDSAISAGALYVTPDEVDQLRPSTAPRRRGAFSIVLGAS